MNLPYALNLLKDIEKTPLFPEKDGTKRSNPVLDGERGWRNDSIRFVQEAGAGRPASSQPLGSIAVIDDSLRAAGRIFFMLRSDWATSQVHTLEQKLVGSGAVHPVDHVFVLVLLVAQPIHGAVTYRRYLRQIESGQPPDRIKLYRETLLLEWAAVAVLAAAWFYLHRPLSDLGFVTPGGVGFYVGAILVAALCGFLVYQWRVAKKMTADQRARQIKALGDLVHMLPRNQREYREFAGLSITAGIVEETIYRGFVIWYLSQFVPLWGAVVASAVIFGLGHSYQGIAGMARTGLVGLGLGALYVFTGSIWLPMIGHALVDILQGRTLVTILGDSREGEADSKTLA